ncbi:MAG: ABC transporter permease [Arachidicoccus sp.]|nr:ABC transporter permease [Arachidicoccus sp.]
MWKHYLKTAWRSLKVNRFYSALNIAGLAIGLATGIMLLLWVQNEFSYDKFNKQYRNIYQLSAHFTSNGKEIVWGNVPGPLSVIAKNIPGIQSMVRIAYAGDVLATQDETKTFDNNAIVYADSSLLTIFDFELIKGNKKNFLPNPYSVALSQTIAKKIFGTDDVIGKIVRFDKDNFTITSVFKSIPKNSSIAMNVILPMAYRGKKFTENGGNGNWKTIDEDMGDYSFYDYVLLYPNANPKVVSKQLSDAYFNARKGEGNNVQKTDFKFENLADVHLIGNDGDISGLRMVEIMMLVSILILIIASINYVNLSTARSLMRLKEVSVKKIIGASKWQLFFQFILETFVLFAIASVISIGLIFVLMPLYNNISGKELSFSLLDIHTLGMLFIVVLGALLSSSIYPALLLSSFQPLAIMRGTKIAGFKTATFRKVLVVLQFAISFALLVSTIIMSNQMRYMRNKDLGYNKSYVFSVSFPDEASQHFDAIKTELQKTHSILSTGTSDAYDISNVGSSTSDINWQGKSANDNLIIAQVTMDKDFISTMKYRFIEGGNFSGTPADSNKFVLNETAVKAMDLKPPYVGQQISFHADTGNIIGVLKDFNFRPLTEAISPIIFFTAWGRGNMLYVRTTGAEAQNAIAAVEKEYKKYNTSKTPFSYNFLDKSFEAHYQSQQRTSALFTTFAAIAIFISCLGLFGLATYTAQVKTKEIGIRKVLGASVGNIVQLISKDFLKLVIIAVVIATPLAYWAMHKWLQGFAYKTSIGIFTFIIAAVIVMLIAFATIGFKAFKAARANPVKSLKTE